MPQKVNAFIYGVRKKTKGKKKNHISITHQVKYRNLSYCETAILWPKDLKLGYSLGEK